MALLGLNLIIRNLNKAFKKWMWVGKLMIQLQTELLVKFLCMPKSSSWGQSETFKLSFCKNFHKNAEISRLVFDRINMK